MSLNRIATYCFLLLIPAIFIACENDIKEVNAITSDKNPHKEHAEDIEIIYSEGGQVKAKLFAVEMNKNRVEKPFTEFKKGVNVKMYNDDLKEVSSLVANYAIKYDNTDETIVRNQVIVTNINGDRLETEELIRNDKTGELHTKEFVTIKTAKETLYGMGMKANEDFSWYRIDSMQGIISVNENPLTN